MAAYGTYVFTPDIFPILEQLKPTKDGELWLVDAITKLARSQTVLVREISNGQFYDGGNKLAYHQAVVDFMLRDPEIGRLMLEYLKNKVRC